MWAFQPLRGLRRVGASPATTTLLANPSSASPYNLRRVCRRWRVQLSQEDPLAQHQIGGNLRSTNIIQSSLAGYYHNLLRLRHGRLLTPHDDPLVIKTIVANKTVHRVLVHNESSTDIIFASSFDKMGIGREKLEPVNTCLRGFSGERVLPLGSVQLVLTLGDPPCQATAMVRFLIVDAPSAYNMLLGRPSLNAIRVVPSAYHMVIKFPTANGVGMVQGNQRIAREFYSASMKQNMVDNIYMDELDMRDEVTTRPAP